MATINTSGLASTLTVGTTNITATVGNVTSAVDTLTVSMATLTSIALTPVNPSVAKGLTEQFTATGTYTDNSTEVLTSGVVWASATPSVATISTSGLASTLAVGTTNIAATVGNVTSPVDTLTVSMATLTSIALTPVSPSVAKGLTEQFTATGTYTDNSTAVLTSGVVWASATPSVATISTSGLASTLSVGTTNITATVGNVASPVDTLMVTPATLTSIALTPVNPSVAKGLTEQFTATGTYTDNSTEVLTSGVVWASATPSVATISTSGLASTLAVGTTNITATVGNVTSPVDTLTVSMATLTSIALTPVNPSVAKGLTEQFTATGTYTDNSTEVLTSGVVWASATPSVATISTSGLATTLAVGTTNITATVGNVTSPVDTLTVSMATLTSIALTPISPIVAKGMNEQFTATGTYSDGTTSDLSSEVTWSSATPSVATISALGVATTLAVGTTNITAAVDGVTSPMDKLTVTVASLSSIAVTPSSPSIANGSTEQFTAIATYTDGSTSNVTSQVTWASSDTGVATISNDEGTQGLATAIAHGTATISGQYDGMTANTTLTVTAAATTTAATSASATFGDGTVVLEATVSSQAGVVDEGTETFTILLGGVVIGSPVTVNVVAGAASTSYGLPAGTSAGTYIIEAVYNGTANFLGYTDESHDLVISAAATASATASASATFTTGGQSVNLSTLVTSAAGTVDEGTETFTILLGNVVIGSPVTVNVSAGAASTSYALPAGTSAGTYIIEAVYNGTTNFLGYTDEGQTLVISAAATASATASASATFTTGGQSVNLSTLVTSAAGTVDEGTETFTILLGNVVIGSPVTVNVSAGAASTSYALPAGTSAGTYVIEAVYNGTTNFLGYTDEGQTLVISAAATASATASASATFSTGGQSVNLSTLVTSAAGTVDEGTETFTILLGNVVIGSPVTVNVSAGAASTSYALPAGTSAGTYIIEAVYNGTTNFLGYTDESQTLVISAAATASATASASATFSTGGQSVNLSTLVTSAAGTVDEGTETFTILLGNVVIGSPVTVNVSAGAASTSYALPAGTSAGTYIIEAVYNGTTNFLGYTDESQTLVISAAATASATASASATFSTGGQSVNLSTLVTSAAGTVDEGTETFTILLGNVVIGSPVTVNVSAGAASTSYALPAGTSAGTYVIEAVYNGTTNFLGYTDESHDLVISAAATASATASASATFTTGGQSVNLSTLVTSAAGTVDEGTETFTILLGNVVIGSPVTVNVSAGAASTSYALPAGTSAGTYVIEAVYNGTTNFLAYTDESQHLVISAAATATAAASASATFGDASVSLDATITSPAGAVDQGTETFTILHGTTPIGTPVTVNVSAGAASASYALPANTPSGTFIIKAVYNGTTDFVGSSDNTQMLTVGAFGDGNCGRKCNGDVRRCISPSQCDDHQPSR